MPLFSHTRLQPLPYYAAIFLAFLFFLFSITEQLFTWMFPDEIVPVNLLNAKGLFGCTYYYYTDTTINRISAAFTACTMAAISNLFSSPMIGWTFVRFLMYLMIPVTLALFFRKQFSLPNKESYIISFLLTGIAFFTASNFLVKDPGIDYVNYHIFGLDIAIYVLSIFSFYALIAWLPNSLRSTKYFALYCFIFAFNINSHEVFLPISGFIIPLFAWEYYNLKDIPSWKRRIHILFPHIVKNRKLWILSLIYIVSATLTILAPGVSMRQELWPSDGGFLEGFSHIILAAEELTYVAYLSLPLLVITFLLAMVSTLFFPSHIRMSYKSLVIFSLLAPVLYFIVTTFLVGITSSLTGSTFLHISKKVVPDWLPTLEDKSFYEKGALNLRQNVFIHFGLIVNIYICGLLTARWLQYKKIWMWHTKRYVGTKWLIISLVLVLFHYDGVPSTRLLSYNLLHMPADDAKLGQRDGKYALAQYILPDRIAYAISHFIFLQYNTNHKYAEVSSKVDRQMMSSSKIASKDILSPLYDFDYFPKSWDHYVFSMYGKIVRKECGNWFNISPEGTNCYYDQELLGIESLLKNKALSPGTDISLNGYNRAEPGPEENGCKTLKDEWRGGEHFVIGDIELSKGLNYFRFKTPSTNAEINFYLIGEKLGIRFPWVNVSSPPNGWATYTPGDSVTPIVTQETITDEGHELLIIVQSNIDQKATMRWQHSKNSELAYKPWFFDLQSSSICLAEYGTVK